MVVASLAFFAVALAQQVGPQEPPDFQQHHFGAFDYSGDEAEALLYSAAPAASLDGRLDRILLRVTASQFDSFLTAIGIADDRVALARQLHRDYERTISDLNESLEQKWQESAIVPVSVPVGGRPPEVEMKTIIRFERSRVAKIDEARTALATLLETTRSHLHESEAADCDAAHRTLRREMMLPLHPLAGSNWWVDLSRDVDLARVLSAGRMLIPELRDLFANEKARTSIEVIEAAVGAYSLRLDGILLARERDFGWEFVSLARANGGDRAASARLRERGWNERRSLLSLNTEYSRIIGAEILVACGPDVEKRWLDLVDRAHFPSTFRPDAADAANQWLATRDWYVDEVKRVRLKQVIDAHHEARRALRAKAMDLSLRYAELMCGGGIASQGSDRTAVAQHRLAVFSEQSDLTARTVQYIRGLIGDEPTRLAEFDAIVRRVCLAESIYSPPPF